MKSSVNPQFPERALGLRSLIITALLLMGVWLVFSGHYDAIHIGYGLFSVMLVLLLNRHLFRLRLFPGDQPRRLHLTRIVPYTLWMIKSIVLSALQVARIVLSPKMKIDLSVIRFHADLPNASAQAILGNSITLTPGTITLDIQQGVFVVHALVDASWEGLGQGIMPGRVAGLYEGQEQGEVTDLTVIRSAGELS